MFLKLLASAFASAGFMFGGLFGAHMGPGQNPQDNGSSTPITLGSFLEGLFGHSSSTPPFGHDGHMGSTTPDMHMGSSSPAIVGVVTAVNGDTLTVSGFAPMDMHMMPGMKMGSSSDDMHMHMASTTYTVDATNAKVMDKGVTSPTVANIAVNDHITVFGTVSGTSVTATSILDGVMPPMPPMGDHRGPSDNRNGTSSGPWMNGHGGPNATSSWSK